MDKLLKSPVVGSVNDVKGIRQLYEKIEIHIRGLQALGVEAQQHVNLCMKNADNDVTVTVTAHACCTNYLFTAGLSSSSICKEKIMLI